MKMTTEEIAAVERQVRYLGEAEARLGGLRVRVSTAKHLIRRRDPDHAAEELMQLINEARRLHLHLQAWENYVIPPKP